MGAPPSSAHSSIADAVAQDVYSSDPKFKKFGQQVERCLSSFENVQEWADCIAFLKNLLKVRPLVLLLYVFTHGIRRHYKHMHNTKIYLESPSFPSGCPNA
jgi:hypothetical protein